MQVPSGRRWRPRPGAGSRDVAEARISFVKGAVADQRGVDAGSGSGGCANNGLDGSTNGGKDGSTVDGMVAGAEIGL